MIPLRSTFLRNIPVAFHEPLRIPHGYVGNSARCIDGGEKKKGRNRRE